MALPPEIVKFIVIIYINIFLPGQQAEKARRGEEQSDKAGRQARAGEEERRKEKTMKSFFPDSGTEWKAVIAKRENSKKA
ncbi:MAG: hypothetical protein ACI3VA_10055 [Candidatus Limivicinus sp.]